ncbi:MAG: hypothetical protein EX270_10205 [Pseudomonadales bacterium]|nr:MAG: hypothetical protein EX270_10205 [Pseudomonadales bacterium]
MTSTQTLDDFYKEISVPGGIEIDTFQSRLSLVFADKRSESDIEYYRLGKKPWKKLRDEVVPVSRFLKLNEILEGRIQFPLDNKIPDCWFKKINEIELGIEVTIERGREKFHLATELNETGSGRGFIGIQDDASQNAFNERLSSPRTAFSTDQALEATKNGILRCLSRKNDEKYRGVFCLLIEAHLNTLSSERWGRIRPDLRNAAKYLPFEEVHIIGDVDDRLFGFQIK